MLRLCHWWVVCMGGIVSQWVVRVCDLLTVCGLLTCGWSDSVLVSALLTMSKVSAEAAGNR